MVREAIEFEGGLAPAGDISQQIAGDDCKSIKYLGVS
jgi:hypothetical protein